MTVPLDWATPDAGTDPRLRPRGRRPAPDERGAAAARLPAGRPGRQVAAPVPGDGWIARRSRRIRVMLLDQRGTGRSTRVQSGDRARSSIGRRMPRDYLLHFRADSIVADPESSAHHGLWRSAVGRPLGQSYGGFITLTLPVACAGGLCCLLRRRRPRQHPAVDADEVYRRTYPRVAGKTRRVLRALPARPRTGSARVADHLAAPRCAPARRRPAHGAPACRPSASTSAWARDSSGCTGCSTRRSPTSAPRAALTTASWPRSWPRHQLRRQPPLRRDAGEHLRSRRRGHPLGRRARAGSGIRNSTRPHGRCCFTGEMMYPWMFDEIRSLRPFKAAAEALAASEDLHGAVRPGPARRQRGSRGRRRLL